MKHHPGDGDHLQRRGGLSPAARPHFEVAIEMLQDHTSYNDDRITRDDKNREPKGKCVGPLAQAQGDDCRQQEPFVRDGIEHSAERAPLSPPPGHPPVQTVCDRRDKKYGHCRPTLPLVAFSLFHPFSIVNGEQHEDRDEQNPGNRDFVGQRHEAKNLRRGKSRSQRNLLTSCSL